MNGASRPGAAAGKCPLRRPLFTKDMAIPDIEIHTGIVKDVVNNGAGITFTVGEPPLLLSLGALPNRGGTLSSVAITPNALDAGEYIAVAVRPSLLQPLNYVLLAYRRPRNEAHPVNFTLAAWILAASIFGMVASIFAGTVTDGLSLLAASVLVAIPCTLRLLSVRRGVRLLRQWQAPV